MRIDVNQEMVRIFVVVESVCASFVFSTGGSFVGAAMQLVIVNMVYQAGSSAEADQAGSTAEAKILAWRVPEERHKKPGRSYEERGLVN